MVALYESGLADGHNAGLTPHLSFTGACVVQREVVEASSTSRVEGQDLSHAVSCKSVVCLLPRITPQKGFSCGSKRSTISHSSSPM